MRAFVAIALPDNVRTAAMRVQAMLPAGRLVDPDNLHLTLAFLDDQPEDLLQDLHDRLDLVRAATVPVAFLGLGTFGGARPRLLFADVAPNPALSALRKSVLGAARRAGITLPRASWRPHVTLARFRAGPPPSGLTDFLTRHGGATLPGFAAQGFGLYRSTLHPDGASYEVLADYPLGPQ